MTFMDVYGGVLSVVFVWVLFLIFSEMYPALAGLALAGALVLGAARRSILTAVVLAIGAATLNIALLFAQWIVPPAREEVLIGASLLVAAFAIICGAGWGLGRLASRLVSGEEPAQS